YVPFDMLIHAPVYGDDVNEAWRLTRALVRAVRAEAAAHAAKFAVFEINGPWEHYEEDWKRMMYRQRTAMETWDKRRPNQVLSGFLAEQGITFFDLFDVFEASKEPERLFYKLDPHWTPAGHRVAAHAVAQFLRRESLVPH